MGGDTQWEVEGGWMGAGHCSHHIWKGEKKKKKRDSQQPRSQKRTSDDFQNRK